MALAEQIRRTEAAEAEAVRLQEVESVLLEQTKKLAALLEKANATIRNVDPVLAVSYPDSVLSQANADGLPD